MKKIFTLISMAFVAMSVNAQEVFDITSLLTTNSSGKYSDVATENYSKVDNTSPNNKGTATKETPLEKGTSAADAFAQATAVTLIDCTIQASTENVDMTIISTPNANDLEDNKIWDVSDQTGANGALSTDACSPKLNVYVAPKGNPTSSYFGYWVINDNGDPSFQCPNDYQTFWTLDAGAVPAKGAYATFKVKKADKLKIGVRIPKAGKNRKVYFVKEKDGSVLAQDQYYAEGYDNNNTNTYTVHATTDYVVATEVNNQFIGYIVVNLPVNEKYYMFSPDTQIGIYGFQFGEDTSGISNVKAEQNADGAIYNLAGQEVDKSFKGIVLKNGKKVVIK